MKQRQRGNRVNLITRQLARRERSKKFTPVTAAGRRGADNFIICAVGDGSALRRVCGIWVCERPGELEESPSTECGEDDSKVLASRMCHF